MNELGERAESASEEERAQIREASEEAKWDEGVLPVS